MSKFLNNFKGKILYTDRMEDAVAFAFVNTEKDKICLLSTASPSYSVWKNFEEK
jgi:UDP-N-acetylmuramoylalanine-D-glutamate ligase